ncbi:MAG: VWA domain-containing protein [Methylococcales bacterium]
MNLAEFHFIRPYWLLALLPALVMLVLLLRHKLSQGSWSEVCDAQLLPFLLQEKAISQSRWPITVGTLATVLVIIALAGPTWQRIPSPVFRNDAALVIALDLSLSMDAEDIKPTRLTRARYKIADILKKRKDGQTALLVYGGDAFTVTPLTDDTNTIDSQLTALTTDIMPSPGNNTDLVLQRAVEMFRRAGLQKGQILLVTDGVDADKTRAVVKNLGGYQLSILGVGSADGAPIPVAEGGFLKDERGNIVIPKLNSDELQELAQLGHGIYETITADDTDIDTFLANFDKAVQEQGVENSNLMLDQWDEKGPWLLLPALPLAALLFRRGLLCIGLLLLLPIPKHSYAMEWQDLWRTKDQQGQRAYQAQDYKKAAEKFTDPAWQAAAHYKAGDYEQALQNLQGLNDATSAYNQGNALAQSGKLPEAIQAYQQALELDPNNADAKYNKDIVEKALEKQQKDQQQQKKSGQNDQSKKEDQAQDKKDQQDGQDQDQQQQSEEKSESAEQQQQGGQKSASEQQPEPSEQQAAEQQKQAEQKAAAEQKAEKAQQAEQENAQQQPAKQSVAKELNPKDETQQANEQWLNRIPDDPAGLLKRKFEYQYKYEYQRKQNRRTEDKAW